ncbi:hypothetical protein ALQ31_00826 [Pseudomonas amygdali pv. morsprunorum]|nr:hypothetical protein ALQ31_00826 [Pseudomonas amygdali pv. morsprunorum]RMU35912.1 hypothetical protein ALP31_00595 [Pseudomonas amygdali pv. morsprunorum]SPD84872.1 membrane protein [Pseudomonas syringae]
MIEPQPNAIKRGLYGSFFLIALFGTMSTFKSDFFWLVCLGLFTLLMRTIYLIYLSESFTAIAVHSFTGLFSSFLFMNTSVIYLIAKSEYGASTTDALSWAMIPALLMLVSFLFIYFTKSRSGQLSFETRDNKVHMVHGYVSTRNGNLLSGGVIVAGIAAMIMWHIELIIMVSIWIALSNLYLLYWNRDAIRILKKILTLEKKHNRSYTFEYVEQLREARSRWWLGRLLKWVISLSKRSQVSDHQRRRQLTATPNQGRKMGKQSRSKQASPEPMVIYRSHVAAFRSRYLLSFLTPIFMGIFSLAITAGTVVDAYFPNEPERTGQSMMLMMGVSLVLSFGGIMMSRGHACGMWILAAILVSCFFAVLPTAPAHWRRFELILYMLGLLFPLLGLLSLNSERGRELRMQWRIIRSERKETRQEMRRRRDLEVHRESLRKRKALRK